jgi:hypothetical protein
MEPAMLSHILANFTTPIQVTNNAWSFVYIIPLAAVLSVVYKTTKIPQFSWRALLWESAVLTASILVFMAIVAFSIYCFCALVLR